MAAISCSRPLRKSSQTLVQCLSTKPLPNERSSKMYAWQINSYGDLKQLDLCSTARIPCLSKPTDVLVKVAAASVNPIDIAMLGKLSEGTLKKYEIVLILLIYYQTGGYGSSVLGGMRQVDRLCRPGQSVLDFPLTLGRDFAGEVVECGLGVHDLRPGDQVWGVVPPHHQGSHAEYVLASSSLVCSCEVSIFKRERLDFNKGLTLGVQTT